MKIEPTYWLIENIWQLDKINTMTGFEKSGKSRLMNWLLVSLYKGDVFDRYYCLPRRILYLCGEEQITVVNSRIKTYANIQGIDAKEIDITFMEAAAMRLDIVKERKDLLEKVLEYDVVVIDPLRRVHGADENDSQAMSNIYNDFRQWSNRHRKTIILLHHTPKIGIDTDMSRIAAWFRGSTDLPAILDTAQYVDRGHFSTKNKIPYDIQLIRQGRFPPMEPLKIVDLGDEKGFKVV